MTTPAGAGSSSRPATSGDIWHVTSRHRRNQPRPQCPTKASRARFARARFARSPAHSQEQIEEEGLTRAGGRRRLCVHHCSGTGQGEAEALYRHSMPSDERTFSRYAQPLARLGNQNNNAPPKCTPTLVLRATRMYRPSTHLQHWSAPGMCDRGVACGDTGRVLYSLQPALRLSKQRAGRRRQSGRAPNMPRWYT